MANKKISDLVATAPVVTAALTDQYECVQGGVSKGGTWQKIVDLISSLTSLTLGGGSVVINPDGSISFANNGFNIAADGSFACAGANFTVDASGNIAAQGGIQGLNGTFGSNISLNTDGSASFAGGQAAIDAAGNLTVGALTFNADGSILCESLSAGGTGVTASAVDSPAYSVGGNPGVTQNITVLTALPSTFSTLHFESGILTSVT